MHLTGIQALRGLAALSVVIYHVLAEYGGLATLDLGALGVQVFFVISGYIMVWSTCRTTGRPPPREFLAHRVLRVVPLYGLATLALTLQHLRAGHEVPWADLVRSLLFIPFASHLDPGLNAPILVAGWTLNFEMAFYALFALGLAVAPARPWRIAALGLAGSVLAGWVLQPQSVPLREFSSWMLLQFLSGMGLAVVLLRRGRMPHAAWSLLALAGLGVFFGYHAPPDARAVAAALLGAPLIVLGFLALGQLAWLRGSRPFQATARLGDASYSLYLFHPFAIGPLHKHLVANWPPALAAPVMLAGAVAVGWLVHRGLEQPLLRWGRRRMSAWGRSRVGEGLAG